MFRKYAFEVLLYGAVILVQPIGSAQVPSSLDPVLGGVTSSDLAARRESFYALMRPAWNNTGSARIGIATLLRNYPDQSERITTAMISALEMANGHRADIRAKGERFDEAFSNYYADLIGAVSSLRDPRAMEGLLGAIDTGGMAANGLADLGASAVDGVIERTRHEDVGVRLGAVAALRTFLTRQEAVRSNPDAVDRVRQALLAALDDPEPWVRSGAASGLYMFREDLEVTRRLNIIAATDSYAQTIGSGELRFEVREAASGALGFNEDQSYFVVRDSETRRCGVDLATDSQEDTRFIGPMTSAQLAEHQMCIHYDETAQDPAVCWAVSPENACGGE